MKNLILMLLTISAMFTGAAFATPDATAVTTEISSWYATDGFITVIGAALAVAAAFAVGFKWLKAMVFGG